MITLRRRDGTALRPLATPGALEVHPNGRGDPVAVRVTGKQLRVTAIRECWQVNDEWWRAPISRLYYEVVLENGASLTLYRDMEAGRWYRQ